MNFSLYEVTGTMRFRGKAPGSIVLMALEPAEEARAIERGNVVLIERGTASLQPGSYRLPVGWKRA